MVASPEAPTRLIGKPIKRREDPRLITGQGSFVDDIRLPGLSHAAVLHSPYAHATIDSIDSSAAKAMPGVLGVFTGEDFADVNPLPCAWQAGRVNNNVNTPRVLAIGEVHFVGDPVAVVVAETLQQATDALDAIHVAYTPLDVVVDARAALADGAPQLHENAPNNLILEWDCGKDEAAVKAAIDAAPIRITQAIANQRAGKVLAADRNKPVDVPPELLAALAKRPKVRKAFDSLTKGKQREYAEHIAEAKREATKASRLEKILPMIEAGAGLHDKYRNC